ncbi:MAG: hypothetical protein WCP22_09615 [Chlamydiota bacterium]
MKKAEKEQMREYVERWKKAGPELEAIRRKELAEFDHAANWESIDALLDIGDRFGRSRKTSGLIEMQRWFMKLAEQQGLRPKPIREKKARYRARRA